MPGLPSKLQLDDSARAMEQLLEGLAMRSEAEWVGLGAPDRESYRHPRLQSCTECSE
jgi:hypothetical protein